jgi:hypothetical protein
MQTYVARILSRIDRFAPITVHKVTGCLRNWLSLVIVHSSETLACYGWSMPNRLIEFCPCYEALREEPLPPYEDEEDRSIRITGIRYRVGRIISESVNHSLRRVYL